jgi:hypothetical protein
MQREHPADTLVPAALGSTSAEERRAPSELVGEAIERNLSERRWLRRDEAHAKIARGLESLQHGGGLAGEVVVAELLAELDAASPAR